MIAGATIIALVILCGCLRCRLSYWRDRAELAEDRHRLPHTLHTGQHWVMMVPREMYEHELDRSKAGLN
jgi:hypothetical protein